MATSSESASPTIGSSRRWLLEVDDREPATSADAEFDVGLHVYDLAKGFLTKYIHSFLADVPLEQRSRIRGIYHSSLVVYGEEYFFEGGVACGSKGFTRFGSEFEYVFLGKTKTRRSEFIAWLRLVERQRFQMAHYHPLNHNCHHFTKCATEFLLGSRRTSGASVEPCAYPSYLLGDLDTIVNRSAVGRFVIPLFIRFTGGVQRAVLDQLLHHDAQRMLSAKVMLRAVGDAGISDEGNFRGVPRSVILFSVAPRDAAAAVLRLVDLETPEEGFLLQCSDKRCLADVARALIAHDALDEFDVQRTVTLLEGIVTVCPMFQRAALFDAWRCLVLDASLALRCTYSAPLNTCLLGSLWMFPDMADEAKVFLLECLCNYMASAHGASCILDARRIHTFVALAGVALAYTANPTVVELGACLLHNMSTGLVVLTKTSLDREFKHHGESHVACRLVAILLYFIADPLVAEQARHLLLMALLQVLCASAELTYFATKHALFVPFNTLLALVRCPSSKRLLQMLDTVVELCVSNPSSVASESDAEEDVESDNDAGHDNGGGGGDSGAHSANEEGPFASFGRGSGGDVSPPAMLLREKESHEPDNMLAVVGAT